MSDDQIRGFILSDAAYYAFECQEEYEDIASFAAAIPSYLRHLMLVPVSIKKAAFDGGTEEADMFGTSTFVNHDNGIDPPSSDPGSIFDRDNYQNQTHHQEYDFDWNLQSPTDFTYMSDGDMDDITEYPYRTQESPVRHSSFSGKRHVFVYRYSMKPKDLESRTPEKIKARSNDVFIRLVSFDPKTSVYTFSARSSKDSYDVRASISDDDNISLSCSCPYWRYNGPEYHAKTNDFLLGDPHGTATTPDKKDPNKELFLCKHAYAVMKRLNDFIDENSDGDQPVSEVLEDNSDDMEKEVKVPVNSLFGSVLYADILLSM